MFGINLGFWIGMGVTAAVVIIGIIVVWAIPPRKDSGIDAKGSGHS